MRSAPGLSTITSESPSPARGDWRLVAPAVAAMAWGGNHFTPLLLMYRAVDGYSASEVDLFLAFYLVGLIPGFLLVGPLSDRFGRKSLVVTGGLLSAAASAILACSSTEAAGLCVGRTIAGVAVAVAMVAGTSWIDELSGSTDRVPVGPRRASLSLTVGFGLGAGVSGALAQWAPDPTLLPYVVQIVVALATAALASSASETHLPDASISPLRRDLRVPRRYRRAFAVRVLPSAPWVFGAAALGYVVAPAIVSTRVGGDRVAFATLLTVLTLGTGAITQTLLPRFPTGVRERLLPIALLAATTGATLCAAEAWLTSLTIACAAALTLGFSYGAGLLAGLQQIQQIADDRDLGAMTGLYCSLTYTGFLLPVIIATLTGLASQTLLLLILAGAAAACALFLTATGDEVIPILPGDPTLHPSNPEQ